MSDIHLYAIYVSTVFTIPSLATMCSLNGLVLNSCSVSDAIVFHKPKCDEILMLEQEDND